MPRIHSILPFITSKIAERSSQLTPDRAVLSSRLDLAHQCDTELRPSWRGGPRHPSHCHFKALSKNSFSFATAGVTYRSLSYRSMSWWRRTSIRRSYAKLKPCFVIGIVRIRSPVAVNIALQTAGRIGGNAGSPRPVGALLVFRK